MFKKFGLREGQFWLYGEYDTARDNASDTAWDISNRTF
jgi:hypothetical protein